MKFINKTQSAIPELVLDDKVARSDKKKAEALNAFDEITAVVQYSLRRIWNGKTFNSRSSKLLRWERRVFVASNWIWQAYMVLVSFPDPLLSR